MTAFYAMPSFATLSVRDLKATASWYGDVLGFRKTMEVLQSGETPGFVHLRRAKYQDLLLVPASAPWKRASMSGTDLLEPWTIHSSKCDQSVKRLRRKIQKDYWKGGDALYELKYDETVCEKCETVLSTVVDPARAAKPVVDVATMYGIDPANNPPATEEERIARAQQQQPTPAPQAPAPQQPAPKPAKSNQKPKAKAKRKRPTRRKKK